MIMSRRAALSLAAIAAALTLWTLAASAIYAWVGLVPYHCWFYYAWPWPDRFLWDGLYLILSGALAAMPFALAGRFYWDTYRAREQKVYGESKFADRKQMKAGGITSRRSL